MSSWNYRLLTETKEGKKLPRIAEVFYNDDEEPQFYSIQSIWENLYWALIMPLKDILRRKPLKDTDMIPDKDTKEMFDFENVGTARMISVEKDKDSYYFNFPNDIMDELDWRTDDTIRFDEVENCTDDGEYNSLVLVNESLEERMKNGE